MDVKAKAFGQFLKELRNKKGYTLTELGDKIGYSNPYLSQIETGQKGIPSPKLLKKLSEGLDIPYLDLMHLAEYIPEDLHRSQVRKQLELEAEKKKVNLINEKRKMLDGKFAEIKSLQKRITAARKSNPEDDKMAEADLESQKVVENLLRHVQSTNVQQEKSVSIITKLEKDLKELDGLIREKIEAIDQNKKEKIQDEIDNHLIFIDEIFENDLRLSTQEVTVTVPTKYEHKSKSGVSFIKGIRTEDELREWLFDLHYLLNAKLDLFYNKKKLSEEEKQKILTMLEMILR